MPGNFKTKKMATKKATPSTKSTTKKAAAPKAASSKATKPATKKAAAPTSAATSAAKKVVSKVKDIESLIRRRAEEIYHERIAKGEHGTADGDWMKAEKELKAKKK